ncbi:MAG: S-methyl-5'-thioinosine phosphorylase [Pseudomonadales bacterium]
MVWALLTGSAPLPMAQAFVPVALSPSGYGATSALPRRGRIGHCDVVLLARHGEPHRIAPHLINYRANVDTLCGLGVEGIIALTTVGGITPRAPTGRICLPHQLIDYSWGRAHTFSDPEVLLHADFAQPFDEGLRQRLIAAAAAASVPLETNAVYGCTQGPRFETAAEIERMARDGCDLVGMTAMPEAALARERGVPYAVLSLVVNPAAGRAADPFDLAAIGRVSAAGTVQIEQLLRAFFEGGVAG